MRHPFDQQCKSLYSIKIFLCSIVFLFSYSLAVYASVSEPQWIMEQAFKHRELFIPQHEIFYPQEINGALEKYRLEDYRSAALIIERYLELALPDGRYDFAKFFLAECYRMLGLNSLALENYQEVVDRFAHGQYAPAAYLRLFQVAVKNNDLQRSAEIAAVFEDRFTNHPLYNSSLYLYGIMLTRLDKFEQALIQFSKIDRKSTWHMQAQVMAAYIHAHSGNSESALILLEYVRRNSEIREVAAEATLMIGDVYFQLQNYSVALDFYSRVRGTIRQKQVGNLKVARTHLYLQEYREAIKLARRFLRRNAVSDFVIEMNAILHKAYQGAGYGKKADLLGLRLHNQKRNLRLKLEIYDELDHLWELKFYCRSNPHCFSDIKTIDSLTEKVTSLMAYTEPKTTIENGSDPRRRFAMMLIREREQLQKRLSEKTGRFNSAGSAQDRRVIGQAIDSLKYRIENNKEWYEVVVGGNGYNTDTATSVMHASQIKYIDWAFIQYMDLMGSYAELYSRSVGSQDMEDSLAALQQRIQFRRSQLVDHINSTIRTFSDEMFDPGLLFRLAEMYYHRAADRFGDELRAYEHAMESEKYHTVSPQFPDYEMDTVIAVYNRIVTDYPQSDMVDDALFFKALAFTKSGSEELSVQMFSKLIENYPESKFFVESNINVGQYYFRNAHTLTDGFRKAEDAFRRVLPFRGHPQFVEAVYYLGWCFFLQDRFDETITTFKFLVEQTDLDFGADSQKEDIARNPLLRNEAIDYIAMSFDEKGDLEEAFSFLHLIGNANYASRVLLQIGELRETDLDYDTALDIYNKILENYPFALTAIDASARIIAVHELLGRTTISLSARNDFFDLYSKGSNWYNHYRSRDPQQIIRADSMSVSVTLRAADKYFKMGESVRDLQMYQSAADLYLKVSRMYPEMKRAAEAQWNAAVINQSKLNKPADARDMFIDFSRNTLMDEAQRESAAYNAVLLSFQLYNEQNDSLGMADPVSLIEYAVKNYALLFPGAENYDRIFMNLGGVYYNDNRYENAIGTFSKVIDMEQRSILYEDALIFTGRSYFGLERWDDAIGVFHNAQEQAQSQAKRDEAYRMLLQSHFFKAQQKMSQGDYVEAAELFRDLDDTYPGSEYGDVALFNAAQAYEKASDYQNAALGYRELAKRYPDSELALDALFNAAVAFEKSDLYQEAAHTYNLLIESYPNSLKARDALFNLALCYERMGEMEKMVETNERFVALYPEENEVEALLFRTADYFYTTQKYQRAIRAFENYVDLYPNSSSSVEALYKMARAYLQKRAYEDAERFFLLSEEKNRALEKAGISADYLFASKAAMALGDLKREMIIATEFILPEDTIQSTLKRMSDKLGAASEAYLRVIQYGSPEMFKAAFRVGELFTLLADSWQLQQRSQTDSLSLAVSEHEISIVTATLLKNSVNALSGALDLGRSVDEITDQKTEWTQKAGQSIQLNILNAGAALFNAVSVMKNAPVPQDITAQPLHYAQYLRSILETVEPLKVQTRDHYLESIELLQNFDMESSETFEQCLKQFARVNFLIGASYNRLAIHVQNHANNFSDRYSAPEFEELLFQIDDIAFELVDRAISAHEEGLRNLDAMNLQSTEPYRSILEELSVLDPVQYGSSLETVTIRTDDNWLFRTDYIENWFLKPIDDGWDTVVVDTATHKVRFSSDSTLFVNADVSDTGLYLYRNAEISGRPIQGTISISATVGYRVYLNGSLLLQKESVQSEQTESLEGIDALLKKGTNHIAVTLDSSESVAEVTVEMVILVDMTERE